MPNRFGCCGLLALAVAAPAAAQADFVNWETPHVNPIAMTPDGTRLLAANTADNRLEVFDLTGGSPAPLGSVPVGLDPVSVRARTNTEVWVVNHISDSISIVDLASMSVIRTLQTGDEPTDVVFAGLPQRAFVSVSQLNRIRVYDPANLSANPSSITVRGEDPRALATDGQRVYAAIFESGNGTTIISRPFVSSAVNPYAGDANPPPNSGSQFSPPMKAGNPAPPPVGLIVRKDDQGAWRDDNGADWSAAVAWNLNDNDLVVIDANSLAVSYVTGLMNINMNLTVGPAGDVVVVGTEAINEVRFEPNVSGIFVRVVGARISPGARMAASGGASGGGGGAGVVDLNPHLSYASPTASQATRDLSIGDPRGIAWSPARGRGYITGMGSNNLIVVDSNLGRLGLIEIGQGPTGIVVDDPRNAAYVLNKFDATISVVDLDGLSEIEVIALHDPTPQAIRLGRPHLYDTHKTSGLGQASCASCHVDGRMDQVGWDLGDPSGDVKTFNQDCQSPFPDACEDWHPMKGPMATQTLIGIIETGPLHWRADRENLAAFNGAFLSLMGDDAMLTGAEMAQFTDFVATMTPPPNPFRNLDGTLKTIVPGVGNAVTGQILFNTANLDGVQCSGCHTPATGTNGQITPGTALGESQSLKVPQMRNLYEKTGFSRTSQINNRGFGFIHDGSTDTLFNFLFFPGFLFSSGQTGINERRDVEAFLLSFSTDTHAGVGAQATVGGGASDPVRRDTLRTIADGGQVGMVAKGVINDEARGFTYLGSNTFQSDRAVELLTTAGLDAAVVDGAIITYTLVPLGSQMRIGIDRDHDGVFDRDEIDACSNPADPFEVPGSDPCPPDIAGGDLNVNVTDLLALLAQWGQSGQSGAEADIDCSGDVNVTDLLEILAAWGPCG